jgi:phosphatidylglycerol lysyltransferase
MVLTILFLWVVISRFTQLEQLKTTLAQGSWSWILAAVLCQIVYYVVFSSSYQAAFYTVGIRTRTRDLIPVTVGSLFVNVVVPVGGAGGAALFAQDLSRRGKPTAGAAAGVLLQMIADFSAFVLILIPGMIYLFIKHDLKTYEIGAGAVLLLMTVGMSTILILGIWKPEVLRRLLNWLQRTAIRIFQRLHRSLPLADSWAEKNAVEFNQAAAAAKAYPTRLLWTITVALAAHILDLLTLYILFQAFHQPISLGALVAGYAVGILFWIVSITPQGIGVVEGAMALTFTSLGIPSTVAAMVSLAFRGLSFWLPMVLGFFAVQRMRTVGENQRSLSETWGVRFAAILVALMGIVNVISAVTPSLSKRVAILEKYSPLEVRHGGHLTSALAGFALILLARDLARRKRTAWFLTLCVLGISVVSHLVKGLDYEEALLASGLFVMLVLMRSHFHARSDRPSIQQGLVVLAGALAFTLVYGMTGFYLLDHHFSVNFGFWSALRQTVVMFTQFYDPGLTPVTRFSRYFVDSIYIVGAVTIGYAGYMLSRPVFVRAPATRSDREQAKEIVEGYGHSSLARSVLFDDKRYYFTPGGSVIGYALVRRTAVTLGDPIGPADDIIPSITGFAEYCRRNDWLPVFYQTLPETLSSYKQACFEALRVGDEGIVNLETFTLEGKEAKHLRSPVNKLTHAGYSFHVHQQPIPDSLLEELRFISNEWLTNVHGSEKRFSLGWFDDDYIRNSPIAAVHAPEGWISAFANIVPEYQINDITIDLMRHRNAIENGTMDFLFVSMFQWAKAQGYHGFNLGLSALSGLGEQSDDPAIEKVLHYVYEHVNLGYNFKGLHNFKEKFNPEWSPRYLIYPGTMALSQAWLAIAHANSGDKYFPLGYLERQKQPAHRG